MAPYKKNWEKKNNTQCNGVGGGGGVGGPPIKNGGNFFYFYSVQGVGGAAAGGVGIGGGPLYMGVHFFLQLSRWPKATSPLQELEVGTHRVPYLLVYNTRLFH